MNMNKYRVETMTNKEYNAYMMGDHINWTEKMVEANSKEEAHKIVRANNDDVIINEKNTKTVEEAEAEFNARVERLKAFEEAEEKRKADNKAKREAKEKEKPKQKE